MKTAVFKAGFSEIDISPPKGMHLTGYPDCLRINEGILDPLKASCSCFECSGSNAMIISLDLLWFDKKYVEIIRKSVSDITGIPSASIMVCCTHTHSSHIPASFAEYSDDLKKHMPDSSYMKLLCSQIAFAGLQAYKDMQPAKMGTSSSICGKECGIGGNRRDPLNGRSDPVLWTMVFTDISGKILGCINKYSLHPTTLHEDNLMVSADYPGIIRKNITKKYPGTTVLFLQGFSGDQSNRHFKVHNGYRETMRVGNKLGEAAIANIDSVWPDEVTRVAHISDEIWPSLRKLPSPEEALIQVRECEERLNSSKVSDVDRRELEVALFGARETYSFAIRFDDPSKSPQLVSELPVEIQILTFDDTALLGIQGELFSSFAETIAVKSPYTRTIITEMANGGLPGYVYDEDAMKEGGYEVGSSLFSSSSGKQIIAAAIKLLKESYQDCLSK